jgi:hypothetical protein
MNTNFISYETAKSNQAEIISDYFDDPFGRWANAAALDPAQREDLLNQNHIDLRGFTIDQYKNVFIIDLMSSSMSSLNGTKVALINAPTLLTAGESWSGLATYTVSGTPAISSGTATLGVGSNHGISVNDTIKITGLDPSYNGIYTVISTSSTTISYLTSSADVSGSLLTPGQVTLLYGTANTWKSLKVKCIGNNTSVDIYCKTSSININNYAPDGYITIALPNFSSNINKGGSIVSFTTDPNGDFLNFSQTDSFNLNSNSVTLNYQTNNVGTGVTNNVELKIPLNSLTNVLNSTNNNKGLITSIKFSITAPSADCWFYCSAIRCISSTWKYAPIDINTIDNAVVKTVSLNGGLSLSTTITSDISSSNTQILVNDATNFPSSGTILINNEYIYYGSKDSVNSNVLNVIRGVNKSVATSHTSGATVTFWDFTFSANNIGSRMPINWPVIYKTFDNLGFYNTHDPEILNGSVYAVIDIGSTIDSTSATNYNQFVFYFRNSVAAITQSDLNVSYDQGDLNVLNTNIDNLYSLFIKNVQAAFSKIAGVKTGSLPSGYTGTYQDNPNNRSAQSGKLQADLSKIQGQFYNTTLPIGNTGTYQDNPNNRSNSVGLTQKNLNETANLNHISYNSASIRWYKNSGGNLQFDILFGDEVADSYTFTSLNNLNNWKNKTLVFKTYLKDTKIRSQLFELKNQTLYSIFDTGQIESEFFHKNRGRFGWGATLVDGTSKIRSIRSGGLVYGEYKSTVMNSYTPVKGAQVFSNQSSEEELVTSVGSNPWSISTNALTTEIDKIDPNNPVMVYTISDPNTKIWQGVATNEFKIENFKNFYATFDIKYNSNSTNLLAFLYNAKYQKLFPLNVSPFNKNQWDSVRLIVSIDSDSRAPSPFEILPGKYSLIFVENGYNNNTPWSIKNISVKERMLVWSGRSFVDGPWEKGDRDWIPNYFVNNLVNNDFSIGSNVNDGMVFAKSDTQLQVKAEAYNQYMEIDNFDIVPKYATLGNFVWRGE